MLLPTSVFPPPALVLALAAALAAPLAAHGQVLAQGQLVTPLAPGVAEKSFTLVAGPGLVPGKPVWVSYSLFAVSAADSPRGEIVVDAMPEGVKVPISDARVVFEARDMKALPSTGTLGERMQQTAGNRSPQELAAHMGSELYAAYQALLSRQGSMRAKTIVKEYPAPGRADLRVSGSIDRASGIQPVLLKVAMGQGEVPAEYREGFGEVAAGSTFKEKLVAAVLAFAAAAVWLRRRLRR